MKSDGFKRLANFFYEIGTLRRIPRAHRQNLMVDDVSDNIASHTFRVTMIAWHLAKLEGIDPYKVVMMALTHDLAEVRSGDQNWIHKKYVKVFEEEITKDQFSDLAAGDEILDIIKEYAKRESQAALIVKDADILDQILLLKEYEWQGNKEATKWLTGNVVGKRSENRQLARLNTEIAKELGDEILNTDPGEWWENIWTNQNR